MILWAADSGTKQQTLATGFQAVWGQDGTVNSSAFLRYQDNYTGGAWGGIVAPMLDDVSRTTTRSRGTGGSSASTRRRFRTP